MSKTVSTLKSAKRTKVERGGVHAWHPYYAGYSEQFVRSAINYLQLCPNDIILDPWSGSGTTGYVCEMEGIYSVGLDVNPVMSYFAQAKSGLVIKLLDEYRIRLQEKIVNRAITIQKDEEWDHELYNFMTSSLAQNILALKKSIYLTKYPELPNLAIKIFNDINTPLISNSIKAFFLCALFRTARKLSGYKKGSNPTWFKKINLKKNFTIDQVNHSFTEICHQMHDDLKNSPLLSSEIIYHYDYVADSIKIPFRQNTFDATITSPPYLTRIDYAISTQLEILILKDSQYLRQIRVNTMGSPVITENKIQVNNAWGKTCTIILEHIKNHASKASKTYYWKNIVQYFDDAYKILFQIYRVLKKGKSALIVVQSSYYKDIEIPLNKVYMEMALSIGFTSIKEPFKEVVKNHMAHVNSKSSTYKKNKVYYESVIKLTK